VFKVAKVNGGAHALRHTMVTEALGGRARPRRTADGGALDGRHHARTLRARQDCGATGGGG